MYPTTATGACELRQVILGFVIVDDGSRWLTHEEISGGVIEAMQSDRGRSVVGAMEPWEERPRLKVSESAFETIEPLCILLDLLKDASESRRRSEICVSCCQEFIHCK